MDLKLSKVVSFLHFFADVTNKSKAVFVYALENFRFTLSENVIGYYAMTLV